MIEKAGPSMAESPSLEMAGLDEATLSEVNLVGPEIIWCRIFNKLFNSYNLKEWENIGNASGNINPSQGSRNTNFVYYVEATKKSTKEEIVYIGKVSSPL